MATQIRTFTHRNDTKGTWRYEEINDEGQIMLIGSLYLRKGTFEKRPQTLEVTVKELP